MVRPIQQIKQDIAALEETVATIAEELHNTYANYLGLLGQSVQRQLILASYQICTQVYPESFLLLSFNQRQQLQQTLQQLGQQTQSHLLSCLEESNQATVPQDPEIKELVEQALNQLPIDPGQTETQQQTINQLPIDLGQQKSAEQILNQFPIDLEQTETQKQTLDQLPIDPEQLKNQVPQQESTSQTSTDELEQASNTDSTDEQDEQLTNPENLAQWQEQLEEAIAETLETVSEDANHTLLLAGILPDKLPAKLIEMAVQTKESAEVTSGPPNLLNLLIEGEGDEESKDVTRITAIRLRLSEIEFSDPVLNAERNQIRNLLAKLSKLRKQYRKKQRERAIAEAETAWRASWFED